MEGAEPTAGPGSSMISFGDVVIDLINYELTRAGDPVPVEPQVFDVLQYLIEHRDRVVSKEELFDNVWGDRFVSESALTSRIKSARQAVGDDGRRQEVIRTTHGRGYRFVAEVVPSPAGDAGAGAGAGDEDVIDLNASEAAGVHGPVSAVPERRVPVPSRPLVARDRELAALTGLLAANRLVTVVGPGGVGKTRLATEVAAHWDQEPVDVISFVALAAVAGPDEVLIAVRDALGIGSAPSVDAIGAIREAMAGKSALLVLDNFEHVVDAATKLVDLVESVPGLRLLVTSRERLGLAGEQVLELEPFSLHTDGSAESSAVTFFQHAVRGVGADIDLTADHHRDAQAICQTLDGLPLAMELAAAQTRYYSLSYLRSHLDSAAITVADRARDRPERHHTMQSTMAWSYRLLTPKQQNLLASLSVFKGSWPLTAADAIAGVDEPGAAAHDLMALVDKSLVRRSAGAAGEPRFMMLGLLRDFAGAQLEASGAREDASRRHAEIMAETVRVLEAGRWGDAGDSWIEAISAEYPDAVKALNWCFSGGDPAIGRQIVSALGFWWYRTGRLGEGRVWVDKALASATAPDDSASDDTAPDSSAVDDSAMAWIHSAAGTLAAYELRQAESFEHCETALDLARQLGDERLESLTLCDLGAVSAPTADDDATALELVKLGLDQARRLGTPQLLAHGLTILGELSRANGDPEQAEAAYREALDLDARLGDRHYEAVNTLNTGHALMAQGRMRDALPYYRYGIELATGIGSRLMMSWNLAGLANAFHLLGWPELSARLIGTAQTTLERLGASHGPVDQPLQDRRQQVLRDDLGSDVYETLVAQGRELTLDEGIELALEALEQQSV